MISSLGVLDEEFRNFFKKSLITLSSHQSEKGQIPNAVDKYSNRKPRVDFKSIDSSLWFIIGEHIYKKRFGDNVFKDHEKQIEKAAEWLSYQDMGEDGMIEQLPTTDWQDAFPHKYGHCINTQALYYKVLKLLKKDRKAEELKKKVNEDKEDSLWNGEFYYAWRWKNHNKYREIGEWFDSLGNLLAIVFGLADEDKSERILKYIEKNKINFPFPVKAIYPPIKKGSKDWRDYFMDCDAKNEWHYLNGGIWGFIGGFYVLALIKQGKIKEAEKQLEKLAKHELKGNFPEWTNPKTRESHGKLQAWSAGMYILAYKSFKNKKAII
jgi:glycogen debranching enzyme